MPGAAKGEQSPVERLVLQAIRDELERRQGSDGLTQNQLAAKAGMSPSQLSNVLNAKGKSARFSEVVALADALGVDLLEIIRKARAAQDDPPTRPDEKPKPRGRRGFTRRPGTLDTASPQVDGHDSAKDDDES